MICSSDQDEGYGRGLIAARFEPLADPQVPRHQEEHVFARYQVHEIQ